MHGILGRPTLLPARVGEAPRAPNFWERVSVHFIFYGVWGVSFGGIVWRGPPTGMIDVRFPFERDWGVVESAEWIYLSVYVVPSLMPWMNSTREDLRRFALNLWWLLLICLPLFLFSPWGAPPREFVPQTLAGRILEWETSRADFAAASLPSFHLIWAWLCADLLARRGSRWAWIGRSWTVAVAVACVANGAHAVLDVIAAVVICLLVTHPRSPVRPGLMRVENRLLAGRAVK